MFLFCFLTSIWCSCIGFAWCVTCVVDWAIEPNTYLECEDITVLRACLLPPPPRTPTFFHFPNPPFCPPRTLVYLSSTACLSHAFSLFRTSWQEEEEGWRRGHQPAGRILCCCFAFRNGTRQCGDLLVVLCVSVHACVCVCMSALRVCVCVCLSICVVCVYVWVMSLVYNLLIFGP